MVRVGGGTLMSLDMSDLKPTKDELCTEKIFISLLRSKNSSYRHLFEEHVMKTKLTHCCEKRRHKNE